MPSKLGIKNSTALHYKRQRVALLAPQSVPIAAPWSGYEPDLRGTGMTWAGFADIRHLIPVAGHLQTDDGYLWVDQNNPATGSLPLGTGGLPSASPQPVVGVFEWAHSTAPNATTRLVTVTANTTAGSGRYFYRPTPTADWAPVTLGAGEVDPATELATFPGTSAVVLHDGDVFLNGAPGRTIGAGSLTTPLLVTCNGYSTSTQPEPAAPVMVIYGDPPVYGILTSDLSDGGAPANHFAARTCCAFQDRMVFAATREPVAGAMVAYPYRVRWSAVGDASLITAATPGAGALDLAEFHTPIQRVLPLGDLLAVYSSDGVAFLSRTLRTTDPFQRRYITLTRGLIGPRAVCSIGRDLHFGIFTDGWYTLGQSGEWNRVGLGQSNETRWDREFYSQLTWDQREQTVVGYDLYRQLVRISFVSTATGAADTPNTTWNLDLRTNTVWPSGAGTDTATYYLPSAQTYSSAAVTWAAAPGTWATTTGIWDDYDPTVTQIPAPVFGTGGGMVFQVSYSSVLQGFRITSSTDTPILGGRMPEWSATSHRLALAAPGQFAAPDQLWVNYRDLGPTTLQLGFTDTDGSQFIQAAAVGGVASGSSQAAYANCHASLRQVGWMASGQGPVQIHSLRAVMLATTADQVRPAGA